MSNTRFIGRVGALAVALGVGVGMGATPWAAVADPDSDSSVSSDVGAGPGESDTKSTAVGDGQSLPGPAADRNRPTPLRDNLNALREHLDSARDDLRDNLNSVGNKLRSAPKGIVRSSGGALTSAHRTGSSNNLDEEDNTAAELEEVEDLDLADTGTGPDATGSETLGDANVEDKTLQPGGLGQTPLVNQPPTETKPEAEADDTVMTVKEQPAATGFGLPIPSLPSLPSLPSWGTSAWTAPKGDTPQEGEDQGDPGDPKPAPINVAISFSGLSWSIGSAKATTKGLGTFAIALGDEAKADASGTLTKHWPSATSP